MLRIPCYLFISLLTVLCQGTPVRGQATGPIPSTDSTAYWQRSLFVADSVGDARSAVRARLALAAGANNARSLRMVREALAVVDSAGLDPAFGLAAAERHVALLSSLGMVAAAGDAWPDVLRYKDAVMQQDARSSLDALRTGMELRLAQAADSMARVIADERIARAHAEAALGSERQLWMFAAIGSGALALVALVLLAALHFGPWKRMRRELAELRQEVTWLRVVHRKQLESKATPQQVAVVPDAPATVPPAPPTRTAPVETAPAGTAAVNEDAVLLELVKRRSVERLYTLREARMRGDREKVLRVVRSLKPQLVSLDAAYFTELCGRLVAEDVDTTAWSRDLDRFEQGVQRLIEERG
jgi:hypothetical protein